MVASDRLKATVSAACDISQHSCVAILGRGPATAGMWWASITCCGQAPSSWRLWPLSPVAVLTTAIVAVVERICLDLLRCCRVTGLRWHFANHIALPAFLFKKTFALACVFRSYLTGLTRLTTDGTRCFGRVAVCSPQRRPVLAKNAKNEEIQHGMHRTDTEVWHAPLDQCYSSTVGLHHLWPETDSTAQLPDVGTPDRG